MAWLALVLFALHAVLPAGFMINLDSLRDGRYEVVICTGSGLQAITVDKTGQRIDADGSSVPDSDGGRKCPFATTAGKALAVPSAPVPLAGLMSRTTAAVNPPSRVQPASAAVLPLGSRAPPVSLG